MSESGYHSDQLGSSPHPSPRQTCSCVPASSSRGLSAMRGSRWSGGHWIPWRPGGLSVRSSSSIGRITMTGCRYIVRMSWRGTPRSCAPIATIARVLVASPRLWSCASSSSIRPPFPCSFLVLFRFCNPSTILRDSGRRSVLILSPGFSLSPRALGETLLDLSMLTRP